jgi:DNA-binding GntR family transcriptional regulator
VMAYYEANLHFHWDIIHASGNREICDIYRGVVQKLHMARLRNLSTDVGILNSIKEHHAIVDAIQNKRADICEALMASHVKAAGERLQKILFEGDKHEEKTSP